MYRAVFVLCGDRGVAEEATQEAFARALERWSQLKDQSWVAGWVTSSGLNAARRLLRRPRWRGRVATDPEGGADPHVEVRIDLWVAIGELPRRQQEAVLLHYVADLPVATVAMAMRCQVGTVKAHLAKARVGLRTAMGGEPVER